ncbi:hypothetical protein F7230_07550 [Corynebacterium sp. 320]|nr:hypothetical protein F7230_07550 [Corynebacterium sp. 320]KAB1552355.1 hypothetical protein F7233_00870 [Corynebacterium sp. 321]KAB1554430.1 hypothetical protein F7232_05725 [Corynebacterium sp. 319]KAB3526507.1 hypothetical protein F8354_07550 [Corynebacterium sp. 250]KAB3539827.1 hypothetical protein F8390_00605 [Corynebacterium sp. 366]
MRNNNNKKEVAIFRIAVLAAILMLAFGIAMNGIIIGIVAAVVSGVFLLYFLVHDRRHFR